MDVQGAEQARPWVLEAKATYPALVDTQGQLGRRFNFNYVPLTILINEEGHLVRGPKPTDIGEETHRQEMVRWLDQGGIEPTSNQEEVGFSDREAELRFRAAAAALTQGDSNTALALLRKAVQLDPDNWLIRKQMWALEDPDRFYSGPVDYEWQKRQLKEDPSPQ